jgi:hypothetical protein
MAPYRRRNRAGNGLLRREMPVAPAGCQNSGSPRRNIPICMRNRIFGTHRSSSLPSASANPSEVGVLAAHLGHHRRRRDRRVGEQLARHPRRFEFPAPTRRGQPVQRVGVPPGRQEERWSGPAPAWRWPPDPLVTHSQLRRDSPANPHDRIYEPHALHHIPTSGTCNMWHICGIRMAWRV